MDDRVAGLVISYQLAFLRVDDQRFPFLAVADLVAGSFKVGLGDMGLVLQGEAMAASLSRFARSAPDMPGVVRAMTSSDRDASSNGLPTA